MADPAAGAARAPLSREAVLAAARSLLLTDGLAGVSLRKLAANLGVTAPALYSHVASKDDLLRALAEDELGRLIERLEDAHAPDPIERIQVQARAYVSYALEHPALFDVMFLFRPSWVPNPAARELPAASKAFAIAAAPVEDAIAAGLLRETDPLMASLTIWSAAHGVASVLLASPAFGEEYEQRLIDSVIDSVVTGLRRD